MLLVIDSRVRRLLVGVLMLTGCRLFSIDPRQRQVLISQSLSRPALDKSFVVTMDEIFLDGKISNNLDKQFESLKQISDKHLLKTTFLDLSDDLRFRPKELMNMVEEADKDSRLVRIKVMPAIYCDQLLNVTPEPNDARLDTIFFCRRRDAANSSAELPEYSLLWDGQFTHINSSFENRNYRNGYDDFVPVLAGKLLLNSTGSQTLIDKPFCPAELKRADIIKRAPNWLDSNHSKVWLVPIICSAIVPIILCCFVWECFGCICVGGGGGGDGRDEDKDEEKPEEFELEPILAQTDNSSDESSGSLGQQEANLDAKCEPSIADPDKTGTKSVQFRQYAETADTKL